MTMGSTTEITSLSKLQKWLQFEKHIWILGGGVMFVPPGMVITLIFILALIFMPILIWHLMKAGWYKSIGVFLAVVILPYTISQFIQFEHVMTGYLVRSLPIVAFFTFTWVLSHMIRSHLYELETVRMWEMSADKNG